MHKSLVYGLYPILFIGNVEVMTYSWDKKHSGMKTWRGLIIHAHCIVPSSNLLLVLHMNYMKQSTP